ncbi:MAG: Crp/Fnr family transcriptional regulator [Flavitalea sp.]
MFEAFLEYLKTFHSVPVTDEEVFLYKEVLAPLKLRKRQYFLQEGERCRYFGFIVKGAMRQYTVDEKGVEHIIRLGVENWWMGDRESWVMNTPSAYNIDAWEDTEMLILTRASALEMISKSPAFVELTRRLDERNNIANQRRLTSSISGTAEKKYTDFLDCYPELVGRFPQHIIASYLGITKDTLSRVRRNLMQK